MSDNLDWGGNPTPLKVMDLTLRDGTQSLFATRMRTEDMIPIAEQMDEVGFWAMEVWGGATFDSMSVFWVKTRGNARAPCANTRQKPRSACCSGARTWWATATTPMTWPRSSSTCPARRASRIPHL